MIFVPYSLKRFGREAVVWLGTLYRWVWGDPDDLKTPSGISLFTFHTHSIVQSSWANKTLQHPCLKDPTLRLLNHHTRNTHTRYWAACISSSLSYLKMQVTGICNKSEHRDKNLYGKLGVRTVLYLTTHTKSELKCSGSIFFLLFKPFSISRISSYSKAFTPPYRLPLFISHDP